MPAIMDVAGKSGTYGGGRRLARRAEAGFLSSGMVLAVVFVAALVLALVVAAGIWVRRRALRKHREARNGQQVSGTSLTDTEAGPQQQQQQQQQDDGRREGEERRKVERSVSVMSRLWRAVGVRRGVVPPGQLLFDSPPFHANETSAIALRDIEAHQQTPQYTRTAPSVLAGLSMAHPPQGSSEQPLTMPALETEETPRSSLALGDLVDPFTDPVDEADIAQEPHHPQSPSTAKMGRIRTGQVQSETAVRKNGHRAVFEDTANDGPYVKGEQVEQPPEGTFTVGEEEQAEYEESLAQIRQTAPPKPKEAQKEVWEDINLD